MNAAVRDMPSLTVTYRDGAWHLTLPDGREVTRKRAAGIERVVRKECPGTSLRWTAGEA